MKSFKRYMVTAALPYANGPVHIGHLAGVYIPADIYVRYLRLRGRDVLYICGSDEHGVPITIKARQENVSPRDIVDKYHNIIKKAFKDFGISFSIYSRTSSAVHFETASQIFRTLYDKDVFIEKTTMQYYDPEAMTFLADRYITGTCPNCGNNSAYGDQCEKCGSSLSPTELIEPKSMISGSKPELRETLHWFLPLDRYEAFLKKWILEENKDWKPNVYGQCKSWLDAGLQPRAVSRDLDWGIPVPVEGAEGKVLYVWFDAPIGYISATRELTPDWEKYWKDEDCKLVHFIGKDNIVFHCIIFPSMLKAEGTYKLPDNVPANEFLNLEGDKISTSRNWAVWLHEYLEDFPGKQDVLRYVLSATMPETKDNDFTWKDFQARNNNELVAILGNFVNRALVLTSKYFDNKVPFVEKTEPADREIYNTIPLLVESIEYNLENYRFREALKSVMDIARLGNKYLAETEPWKTIKTDEQRTASILNTSLQLTARLAVFMQPFLPFTAEKLLKMLGMKEIAWDEARDKDKLLDEGHLLGKAELLFEKIEDDDIEKQLQKLKSKVPEGTAVIKQVTAQKDLINYDQFSKMDIRTGTILEAERVPKTDKLIKMKVNTGIDTRTIVSGIAGFFEPEKLPGKKVCVLVNLEPRKIKGIESKGMILLAEDTEGRLVFVTPEEDVPEGSEVK